MVGEWRERGAGRDSDPEVFFPVGTSGPALVQTASAKAVCARCPVQAQCLVFALEWLPEGIAGGLTAAERRACQPARPRSTPRGVRAAVLTAVLAGESVTGASVAEMLYAALVLRRAGYPARWIATHLGVNERRVERWFHRERITAAERVVRG